MNFHPLQPMKQLGSMSARLFLRGLITAVILLGAQASFADDVGKISDEADPVVEKDQRPNTDHSARLQAGGVFTQGQEYQRLSIQELEAATTDSEIAGRIGPTCESMFSVAGKVDYTACKAFVLKERYDHYISWVSNSRQTKSYARTLIGQGKSLGVPEGETESKLKPIMPPLLTFGQAERIYGEMNDPDPAAVRTRLLNQNQKKLGIAHDAFLVGKEFPVDADNPSGEKYTVYEPNPATGSLPYDNVAYQKAVAAARGIAKAEGKIVDLNRLRYDEKADVAKLETHIRGTPHGKRRSKLKEATDYLDPVTKEKKSIYKNIRTTFNLARKHLLDASNKELAKLGAGGGGVPGRRPAFAHARANSDKNLEKPLVKPRAAKPAPSDVTPEEQDANEHESDNYALSPEAAKGLGQFSIGYSDKDQRDMLNDAAEKVMIAP